MYGRISYSIQAAVCSGIITVEETSSCDKMPIIFFEENMTKSLHGGWPFRDYVRSGGFGLDYTLF